VAENQPANKNRMTTELSNFAARLREIILSEGRVPRGPDSELRTPNSELRNHNGDSCNSPLRDFNSLALELFALQFQHNAAYRKICAARGLTPGVVEHWTRIPAVPTSAFKELELTCLAPGERTTVFHSSGTTEQKPSRHFHNADSLAVYEASLWVWFEKRFLRSADSLSASSEKRGQAVRAPLVILTPSPMQAPHSSLVHMFETVRQKLGGASVPALLSRRSRWGGEGGSRAEFLGRIAADSSWTLNLDAVLKTLREAIEKNHPLVLLATAFSFVHLLDFLAEQDLRFQLPAGSRVMETGGYKNRSRSLPKAELHKLIAERLEVPPSHIICEYGMSELSSQAYDGRAALLRGQDWGRAAARPYRVFRFPPWARVQIISPETGCEVADGETGLIRVFDLANVFSVMAIQTEDLGIRRAEHFELIGRAALAEPRGCSLMVAETRKS
jgi:hypothetical protein